MPCEELLAWRVHDVNEVRIVGMHALEAHAKAALQLPAALPDRQWCRRGGGGAARKARSERADLKLAGPWQERLLSAAPP